MTVASKVPVYLVATVESLTAACKADTHPPEAFVNRHSGSSKNRTKWRSRAHSPLHISTANCDMQEGVSLIFLKGSKPRCLPGFQSRSSASSLGFSGLGGEESGKGILLSLLPPLRSISSGRCTEEGWTTQRHLQLSSALHPDRAAPRGKAMPSLPPSATDLTAKEQIRISEIKR